MTADLDDWRDWHKAAACKKNPGPFYDPEGEKAPEKARREAEAKAICEGCLVLMRCRVYALGRPEQYGFWAGLSEDGAKALRRSEQARGRVREKRRVTQYKGHRGMRDTGTRRPCQDEPACSDGPATAPETLRDRRYRERAAKTICWECPVRLKCETDALDYHEVYGVRGGWTEEERRRSGGGA